MLFQGQLPKHFMLCAARKLVLDILLSKQCWCLSLCWPFSLKVSQSLHCYFLSNASYTYWSDKLSSHFYPHLLLKLTIQAAYSTFDQDFELHMDCLLGSVAISTRRFSSGPKSMSTFEIQIHNSNLRFPVGPRSWSLLLPWIWTWCQRLKRITGQLKAQPCNHYNNLADQSWNIFHLSTNSVTYEHTRKACTLGDGLMTDTHL